MSNRMKVLKITNPSQKRLPSAILNTSIKRREISQFPISEPTFEQKFQSTSEAQRSIGNVTNFDEFERAAHNLGRLFIYEDFSSAAWEIFTKHFNKNTVFLNHYTYVSKIIPEARKLLTEVEYSALEGKNSRAYGKTYEILEGLFYMFHPNPALRKDYLG